MFHVMVLPGPEPELLEIYKVFEITKDASFIDAPIDKDNDKPMAEDAGLVGREAEIANTTTPQVHVAPATAMSSPPQVSEKKVRIIHLNMC